MTRRTELPPLYKPRNCHIVIMSWTWRILGWAFFCLWHWFVRLLEIQRKVNMKGNRMKGSKAIDIKFITKIHVIILFIKLLLSGNHWNEKQVGVKPKFKNLGKKIQCSVIKFSFRKGVPFYSDSFWIVNLKSTLQNFVRVVSMIITVHNISWTFADIRFCLYGHPMPSRSTP